MDWNSKTRLAGQLREEAGLCPDHIFFIPEVRRSPWPHMRRKAPWRSKGNDTKLPLSPAQSTYFSFLKSGDLPDHTCAERLLEGQRDACRHMEGSWDTPNMSQAHQNDRPQETQKKRPIKVTQIVIRARLSNLGLSLWVCPCVYPHVLYSFTKYFTCFTTFNLCGNSFLKDEGPGPSSL